MSEDTEQVIERYGPLNLMPEQPTKEQRDRARASALYELGDIRLVWINEGDLDTLLTLARQYRGGDDDLIDRLTTLYAQLATVSKNYDAEAVAEAIQRLRGIVG